MRTCRGLNSTAAPWASPVGAGADGVFGLDDLHNRVLTKVAGAPAAGRYHGALLRRIPRRVGDGPARDYFSLESDAAEDMLRQRSAWSSYDSKTSPHIDVSLLRLRLIINLHTCVPRATGRGSGRVLATLGPRRAFDAASAAR